MATYLAAVWKGRQPTVSDVVNAYRAKRKDTLSKQAGYPLERIARHFEDTVATKLRASDLTIYFEEYAVKNASKPATVLKDFALLRAALGGLSAAAFADAAEILKRKNLLPGKHETPIRRVSQEDFETIAAHFRGHTTRPRKHLGLSDSMIDVIEFALWSGRRPKEITSLKWADVDFQNHTCHLPGETEVFPVLERAWEILKARHTSPLEPGGRIFPFPTDSITGRYTTAVRALVAEGKLSRAVAFQDFRHEAAYRLLGKGYSAEVVARATGLTPARIHKISEDA